MRNLGRHLSGTCGIDGIAGIDGVDRFYQGTQSSSGRGPHSGAQNADHLGNRRLTSG